MYTENIAELKIYNNVVITVHKSLLQQQNGIAGISVECQVYIYNQNKMLHCLHSRGLFFKSKHSY